MSQLEKDIHPNSSPETLVPYACGISRYHQPDGFGEREDYSYDVIFPGTGRVYSISGPSQEFLLELSEVDGEIQEDVPETITDTNFQVIAALSQIGDLTVFFSYVDQKTGEEIIVPIPEEYDPQTDPIKVSLKAQQPDGWKYDIAKITFAPPPTEKLF